MQTIGLTNVSIHDGILLEKVSKRLQNFLEHSRLPKKCVQKNLFLENLSVYWTHNKNDKRSKTMAGQTIYLSKEKFIACGYFARKNLEYITNGFVFVKKNILEVYKVEETLNLCQKYSNLNLNTIVVISPKYLTVWVEDREKSSSQRIETTQSKKDLAQDHSAPQKNVRKYRGREYEKENVTPNCNLSCNDKVVKKYRGQTYQEAVVDRSSPKPEKPPEKFRRKYRGQYID